MKGNLSNHPFHLKHSWQRLTQVFVQRCSSSTLVILNGEANDNGSLATVISIVYHGRSRLYTLVTVAMVIDHTSCQQALNPKATNTLVHNLYYYNTEASNDHTCQHYCIRHLLPWPYTHIQLYMYVVLKHFMAAHIIYQARPLSPDDFAQMSSGEIIYL